MDQYCVVLCGLQAGASDQAAAWQPVAAALKLDQAEFERRVVAALPRIVRQGLDQATAERIAQVLQALQVDARVLPHDPQLVYIERAGASCGPLPQSSLDDFIRPGEAYRLRGDTTWRPWPEPATLQSAVPTLGFGNVDDATPSAWTGDEAVNDMSSPPPTGVTDETSEPWTHAPPIGTDGEPECATPASPSADPADQRSDIAQEVTAADADAELRRAMPPALGSAPAAQPPSTPEFAGHTAATPPGPDAAAPTRDDELVEPPRETLPSGTLQAAAPTTYDVAEAVAPKRSRWLVMLVVLIALVIWAYHYWTASTHGAASPTAVTAIQHSSTHPEQSTPPAPVVPAVAPTPLLAASASVAVATSTPALAATASAPATADSTPAAAATTAMPPAAAATPVPATSAAAVATASSSTLPASAGTVISARSVLAAAASTAVPETPAH